MFVSPNSTTLFRVVLCRLHQSATAYKPDRFAYFFKDVIEKGLPDIFGSHYLIADNGTGVTFARRAWQVRATRLGWIKDASVLAAVDYQKIKGKA